MFQFLRSTVSGAALGGILWILCCVVAPFVGAGDWMVANSYAMSNWLMIAGGCGGSVVWLMNQKRTRSNL